MKRQLSYANVMSTLAVFLALGGVSYAAIKLPKDSVGSGQIKKNAVTGAKVKDKSLTAADFKGSIQGPAGPAGPAGPKGDTSRGGGLTVLATPHSTSEVHIPAGQTVTVPLTDDSWPRAKNTVDFWTGASVTITAPANCTGQIPALLVEQHLTDGQAFTATVWNVLADLRSTASPGTEISPGQEKTVSVDSFDLAGAGYSWFTGPRGASRRVNLTAQNQCAAGGDFIVNTSSATYAGLAVSP